MSNDGAGSWICCLLGARDHFAIPVALHRMGLLARLVTDAWVRPGSALATISPRLAERVHPDLPGRKVASWNLATLAYEAWHRSTDRPAGVRGAAHEDQTMRRNAWFQRRAVQALRSVRLPFAITPEFRPTLFAYSYAALEPLRFARAQGWRTVLGQIDPGVVMEERAGRLAAEFGWPGLDSDRRPKSYWTAWREECALADRIVVNSSWSRDCLVEAGLDSSKIRMVPLGHELQYTQSQPKEYPLAFTRDRPLRVLFVGQVVPLKGVLALLDAVSRLPSALVELTIVGPVRMPIADRYRKLENVRWIGAVSRKHVAEFYQRADVLVFPSFCDGFGLVQVEAQAWKVPVIASRFCGEVVRDNESGILLDSVTSETIASAVERCLDDPSLLAAMSRRSGTRERFTLSELGRAVVAASE